MDKTVKELADAYGVTKQAINYHIKKLSKDSIKFDSKGTKLISEQGQKELDKILSKEVSKEVPNFGSKDFDTERYIKSLEEQVAYLKKQIDIKDEQIAQWSASATTIKLLAEQKPLAIEVSEEKAEKKTFLARLFRL